MIYRDYSIERDEQGKPTKLYWRGDYRMPTKAEIEAEKLAEWEKIYGKHQAEKNL